MASKSMSCQNLPWRHDVQNISWRQKIRQKYVRTSESSPWRQNIRHDVNTRLDDKMLVITSKGLSKRHHVKTMHGIKNTPNVCHEVKNTSWCQKVCHEVKNTSWRQTINRDFKKFVIISKKRQDVPELATILSFPKIWWLTLDPFLWYFLTISVLYQDMSVYSFVAIRPHFMVWYTDRQTDIQQRHQHYNNLALRN